MSGIIRYAVTTGGGGARIYDTRCSDCVDFSPSWVEDSEWIGGDREATEEDAHLLCSYCDNPVYGDPSPSTFQYAEGFKFITVYEMDRAYGGPEEGGWWYDTGSVVLCRQVPSGDALRIAAELKEEYPYTGKRYSVVYPGYGDYDIVVDDMPGKDFPEFTPHYE